MKRTKKLEIIANEMFEGGQKAFQSFKQTGSTHNLKQASTCYTVALRAMKYQMIIDINKKENDNKNV